NPVLCPPNDDANSPACGSSHDTIANSPPVDARMEPNKINAITATTTPTDGMQLVNRVEEMRKFRQCRCLLKRCANNCSLLWRNWAIQSRSCYRGWHRPNETELSYRCRNRALLESRTVS